MAGHVVEGLIPAKRLNIWTSIPGEGKSFIPKVFCIMLPMVYLSRV